MDETNSSAQKQRNTKEVVFKSVVCIMLPVLSDIYKTWNYFFEVQLDELYLFLSSGVGGSALSCPVG